MLSIVSSLLLDVGTNAALMSVDVSSDGSWLAAGDDGGKVHVWALGPLTLQPVLRAASAFKVGLLAWSPRASTFGLSDSAGRVELHSWPNDQHPIAIGGVADQIFALRWLPDGEGVITSGSDDGTISIAPINGGRSETLPSTGDDSVSGLAVTSEGRRLFSIDVYGKLSVWDLPARRLSKVPQISTGIRGAGIALSHDQRRLLLSGRDGDVLIYRLR